jgi:tungstate transport system substrate-binding protein
MSNDFVLIGPEVDTAGLKSLDRSTGVKDAFRCIAVAAAPFVSRGDRSGTHLRELQIWEEAGVTPEGDWYAVSSGIAGNMGVVRLAQGKRAYALVDRATFILSRSTDGMNIYRGNEEGTALPGELDNDFSLVLVNPQRVRAVNFEGALHFARWIREAQAIRIIEGFGREIYGRPLFKNVSEP